MDKIIENLPSTNDEFYIIDEPRTIDKQLLKKLKKSSYSKDNLLLRLINLAERKLNDDNKVPARVDYVKKRETDTLPSAILLFWGSLMKYQ